MSVLTATAVIQYLGERLSAAALSVQRAATIYLFLIVFDVFGVLHHQRCGHASCAAELVLHCLRPAVPAAGRARVLSARAVLFAAAMRVCCTANSSWCSARPPALLAPHSAPQVRLVRLLRRNAALDDAHRISPAFRVLWNVGAHTTGGHNFSGHVC